MDLRFIFDGGLNHFIPAPFWGGRIGIHNWGTIYFLIRIPYSNKGKE